MAAPGSSAHTDAFREDVVAIRQGSSTVTLGRGTHPRPALVELERRGLVARDPTKARAGSAITDAGRAWLRRAVAGDFAGQHRETAWAEIAAPDGSPERVVLNAAESPLTWLRRRRGADGEPLIDAAAFEAGERLRRDLTTAAMLPSVTARWDGAIGSGGAAGARDPAAATDATIAARQRARAALTTVGGELADLLVDLCGFLKGLEAIERDRSWPPRSGKIAARLALGRLAEHYGLASEARGRDRGGKLRSWWSSEPEPGRETANAA